MKMTLLEMTQSIMSDMDSDEISSITDTPEATQVASTIRDVYDQLVTDQTIPEFNELKQLETVVLADHPGAINYLHIPDTVSKVCWFQYNRKQLSDTTDAYKRLTYMEPGDFLDHVAENRSDAPDTVQVTDPINGVTYRIPNDVAPNFWTTFDDDYLAVDNIDMGIDTVQILGTKTRCLMTKLPTWTVDDDFIPDIDDNFFPLLLAEAKSTCFFNLKQMQNNKIEGQSRGQRLRLQNSKYKTSDAQKADTGATGPNYGRRTPRQGFYLGGFYNS